MRLSDLKTGEQGIIVKVTGYGGFRKRIVEMGFIRGKKVEVLLNAPLKDPIKYKIMGYEVSLRRSEAEMIEVVSEAEAEAVLMQENTRGAKQSISLWWAILTAAKPRYLILCRVRMSMWAIIRASRWMPKKGTPRLRVIG